MELRDLLDYHTGNHPGGLLLDGESNDIRYRKFTVFELGHVFNMSEKLAVPIFLFLFREIERRMLERLDLVRLEPSLVVDVGSGLGHGAATETQDS